MINELYFENVAGIGNLYLEHIFLEFCYEPIFFTCVSDKGNLYLCLCSEIRGGQKWVVSKCNIDTLQALINGEMDMASALCMQEQLILITRDLRSTEQSSIIDTADADPLDLPKAGTLLECDTMSAMDYLTRKRRSAFLVALCNNMPKTTHTVFHSSFKLSGHNLKTQYTYDVGEVIFEQEATQKYSISETDISDGICGYTESIDCIGYLCAA